MVPFSALSPRRFSRRDWFSISLVPIGIVALNIISTFVFKIPNQASLLIVLVVYSALLGGVWIGVLASVIHLAYAFWFLNGVDVPAGAAPFINWAAGPLSISMSLDGFQRFVVLLVMSPSVAIAAGVSRRRISELQSTASDRDRMVSFLFDGSSVGIAYAGVNGIIQRCNNAFANLVGRKVGEVEGMNFADLIYPEDREVNLSFAKKLVSGMIKEFKLDSRYSKKTGGFTTVQKVVSLVRDANGKPQGFLAFARDLSEEMEIARQRDESEHALRKSTDELTKSQELLSLAEQSAKAGSWTWEVGSSHLNWSPAMFTMFGVDPQGKSPTFDTWRNCLHPLDAVLTEKLLNDSIANKKLFSVPYRVVHKNGDVKWISAIGQMTYDAQGQPFRMYGICIDITERVGLEEASHKREEQLRMAVLSASMGFFRHDMRTDVVEWDDEVYRLFGYEPQSFSVSLEKWLAMIDPEDLQRGRDDMALSQGSARPYVRTLRVHGNQGRQYWIEAQGRYEVDDNGKPVVNYGLIVDITARKQAELQLQESEASLRAFFDNAAIGAVQLDDAARYIRVNPAYCAIVGYTSDELLGGMTPTDIDAPEFVAADRIGIARLLKGENAQYVVEKQIVRKDGTRRWVRVATSVVERHNGRVLRTAALVTDITAKKEAEASLLQSRDELQALNLSLEAQVQSRTASLVEANRQLDRLARMDALTGIPNRLAANEKLRQEFVLMKRMKQPYSVLMIDIDHFKAVNDTYGHEAGDLVLKEIAQRLRQELRESDFIARFGGEEFIAFLPATVLDGGLVVAGKLRQSIEDLEIPGVDRVTISIGVSVASPENETQDEAVNAADDRLYEAKAAGRNTVVGGSRPQANADAKILA